MKDIEVWGLKLDFEMFNWSNYELDCEKNKVWRSIKNLIAYP
jgi:hypothetical protein